MTKMSLKHWEAHTVLEYIRWNRAGRSALVQFKGQITFQFANGHAH